MAEIMLTVMVHEGEATLQAAKDGLELVQTIWEDTKEITGRFLDTQNLELHLFPGGRWALIPVNEMPDEVACYPYDDWRTDPRFVEPADAFQPGNVKHVGLIHTSS